MCGFGYLILSSIVCHHAPPAILGAMYLLMGSETIVTLGEYAPCTPIIL